MSQLCPGVALPNNSLGTNALSELAPKKRDLSAFQDTVCAGARNPQEPLILSKNEHPFTPTSIAPLCADAA